MKDYIPRLIDSELSEELNAFGAVLIVGPKWCGKSTTAKQISKSIIELQDPDKKEDYQKILSLKPSRLLNGDKPRLIDEWQMAPVLWDSIRHEIDTAGDTGQFILTGSTTVDWDGISHSGAGRISRLRMYTMSLYESGDSTGDVSLTDLFSDPDIQIDGEGRHSLDEIAYLITRGGWPGTIGKNDTTVKRIIRGYCENILNSDIMILDKKQRDEKKMRAILKSLSRNISTAVKKTSLIADIKENSGLSISLVTLDDYLDALRKIYLLDEVPSWNPRLRSKARIRTADVIQFTDPAVAAYFLDASPKDMLDDPNSFGFLFESLVIRELRIYAQIIGGTVYRYHDSNDLEVDAVIHLNNGEWCAIEIKLGSGWIDDAVKNLNKLKNSIDTEKMKGPSFMAVIIPKGYVYTREDGIHVIPIDCLKN